MPEALMVVAALGVVALILAGLWWLARRPDYLDQLPATDVSREPGLRGWYRTRSQRRARAERRERLEQREYQHQRKKASGGDDPTDLPPGFGGL
jgi:hypothetical protein